MRRPSGQCAMPDSRIVAGSKSWISRPSKRMRPVLGRSRPEIARSVEDLPAPLAPIRQTSSPAVTTRSIPRSAMTAPYAAATPSSFSTTWSEVRADHVGVRLYGHWRALGDHRAVVEHDHGVAESHHDSHVVLDQKHGDATITDGPDEPTDHVLLSAGHAGRRLVEKQDRRSSGQCHRQLDQPLLAVGQDAGDVRAAVREADEAHDGLGLVTERRLFLTDAP